MISVVGYIKVDEAKPERVDYLIASIRSLQFLGAEFILGLETPTAKLISRVIKEVSCLKTYNSQGEYGKRYCELLKEANNSYVLNFLEDHFCVCDDIAYIESCVKKMTEYNADVCKATFNRIELNSISTINPLYNDERVFIYDNNYENHLQYQKHYGSRYYLGVNFITTMDFAKKFWGRNLGRRPHEYEVMGYDERWRHTCMIPKQEILCSIDDPHGEAGTELLSRDNKKFKQIYDTAIQRPVI